LFAKDCAIRTPGYTMVKRIVTVWTGFRLQESFETLFYGPWIQITMRR